MKRHWVYYVLFAFGAFSCASQGRLVWQGDEYDDVYFVGDDIKKAEVRQNQRVLENNGLTSDAYNSEYDQRPISNFSNPDALDYPVTQGGSLYVPMNSQSANWNSYNSWNNNSWNNCWNTWNNCWSWNSWGYGWNSWNNPYWYSGWNSPYGYYNGWNNPYWYGGAWGNPYWNIGWGNGWYIGYYGWSSWNRPWGWNSGWGNTWSWNDNRIPQSVYVGPRASAGRGSNFIRNNPNPRLETNNNNNNDNNQGGRVITGGRTRNYSSDTYTPTQSNEVWTGRIKTERSNTSPERHNNSNVERYRSENDNRSSWGSRSNSNHSNNSSSFSGGSRERSFSSGSSSIGRSGGSSGGSLGRGRTGGRGGR